ncbi:MAG: hypothetical protein ACXVGQ_00310 [Mycobacteriaceae bacterium]
MKPRLARRLVQPDHDTGPAYVETYGPEVADLCAAADFAPDPQQELALDRIFAIRADGLSAAFAFCIICCRQNMKTGLFKQAAVGWLYVTEQRLVVWSAHEMSTTRDALRDLEGLITGSPALSKRLAKGSNNGVYDANGQERIELETGQRILFKARTFSGGRGLTGDKVILDEAFALQPAMMGALLPTLTARPDPQVLYGSSAGKAESHVLRDVRDRGRAGSSPRLSYLEWLAPREECETPGCEHPKIGAVGCALDREHLRIRANPTLTTGRITLETLEGLRQELPPEEFARECLGWWDEEDDRVWVLPKAHWLACEDVNSTISTPPVFALDIAPDRSWAAIAAAGLREDDLPHVEITSRDKVFDHRPGVDWVVPRLKQLRNQFPMMRVLIASGAGGKSYEKTIEAAGIPVEVITAENTIAACGYFYDRAVSHSLRQLGQPELRSALAAAVQMSAGDGAFKWSRRKSDGDITPLYAATLALWGAVGSPTADVSVFFMGDLDSCDSCGEPAGDDAADRDYLCQTCWNEREGG